MSIFYEPKGSTRIFEVEVGYCPSDGQVTLYVGGCPILYLDDTEKCIKLVRQEPDDRIGLALDEGNFPKISRPIFGIRKDEEICGGEARFAGTRIPIWIIAKMRQLGCSDEEIIAAYPKLSLGHLNFATQYIAENREEIRRAAKINDDAMDDKTAREERARRIRDQIELMNDGDDRKKSENSEKSK